MEVKVCSRCNEEKPIEAFSQESHHSTKRLKKCKPCQSAYLREYYQRNLVRIRAKNQAYFEKHRERNRVKCREYYANHRQQCQATGRHYLLTHREQKRALDRAYNQKHRAKRNGQLKHRYHHDITYKLAVTLRNRLNTVLRLKATPRIGSAIRDLGCSLPELKHHLEQQFLPGMTWENHGKGEHHWHIDHIRPLSSFDLTTRTQFRKACHWKNVQPLWREDNLKKGVHIMPWIGDRMTVNWTSPKGVQIAERFRKLAGERGMNAILKQLVEKWVKEQDAQAKGS